MHDLSLLAGITEIKTVIPSGMTSANCYYLQQMGIDVWSMRDLNDSKKIMILIDKTSDICELSNIEQRLLNMMLASIGFSMQDMGLKVVRNIENEESLNRNHLLRTSVIIVMGENIWQWFKQKSVFVENRAYYFNEVPIFNIHHPAQLLKNAHQKKAAYHELLKLEQFTKSS